MNATITVELGANNIVELGLTESGALLPATGTGLAYANITSVQIKVGSTLIDSSISPELFDLTPTDKICLLFGEAPLVPGTFYAKLRIFTADAPLGLMWVRFTIIIEDGS